MGWKAQLACVTIGACCWCARGNVAATSSGGGWVTGTRGGAGRVRKASRKSHKSALDTLRTKPSVAEALRRAQVEQAVEDYNGQLRLEGGAAFGLKAGRFIVMPFTELLDPPKGSVLHGKLQYSDKVMLPKSFLYEILNRRLEPPWNFEIEPLQGDPLRGYEAHDDEETEPIKKKESKSAVPRVYCSNFDFRAPENYIFVPDWMMRTLKLKPRDVVSLKFVRLPADGVVTFRPHSAEFSRLANAHAVLEAELKYYSCVTRGTTIQFKYNNRVFDLDVEDIRDAANNPAQALKMQDSDVQTDIKPPREEEEREARRRQQQQNEREKAKASPPPPPPPAAAAATAAGHSGGSGVGTKVEL